MSRTPGFTLAEMLISLVVVGVIVVGLASTLVVTSQTLPGASSVAAEEQATSDASALLARITGELAFATSVTTATPTQVTFTVDEGGQTDTITYSWSGTAGAALLRQAGGKSAKIYIDQVNSFALEYLTEQTAGSNEAPLLESSESQLLQLDATSLSGGTALNFEVSGNNRVAQRFQPSLPPEATEWRMTRVHLDLKNAAKKNNKDSFRVSVAGVTGNGRPGNAIDSVTLMPEAIVDNAWNEFAFTNASGLDPTKPYCVLVDSQGGGGQPLVKVKYQDLSSGPANTTYFDDTGGGTWGENTDRDLYLWVWGRYSYPDASSDPSGPAYITGIQLTLDAGPKSGASVATAVATLYNEPEAPK
ncbi:MAG: prepilin-type N-terminal cleavage/methylation domain-containing protein [Phycisphaerales bacterium]